MVDLWSVWLQGKTERKSQIDTESDQDLSSSCKSNTRWPSLVVRQTVILIRCQVSSPLSWQRKGWEQAQISHRNYYVTVLVIEIGMFLRSTSTSTRYKNSHNSNFPSVSAELCLAEVLFEASIAQVWLKDLYGQGIVGPRLDGPTVGSLGTSPGCAIEQKTPLCQFWLKWGEVYFIGTSRMRIE